MKATSDTTSTPTDNCPPDSTGNTGDNTGAPDNSSPPSSGPGQSGVGSDTVVNDVVPATTVPGPVVPADQGSNEDQLGMPDFDPTDILDEPAPAPDDSALELGPDDMELDDTPAKVPAPTPSQADNDNDYDPFGGSYSPFMLAPGVSLDPDSWGY